MVQVNQPQKMFSIVVAVEKSRQGIGYHGQLPWSLKEDLSFFRAVTSQTRAEYA